MGPNFTGLGPGYDWLPRSEVAGRSCPADQAEPRPLAVTDAVRLVRNSRGRSDPSVDGQAHRSCKRPIVTTPNGVRPCPPSEVTLDLLEKCPPGPFAKEDGELIIVASGRRVA
jgi:hypothetical protein